MYEQELTHIASLLEAGAAKEEEALRHNTTKIPEKREVYAILTDLFTLMFPSFFPSESGKDPKALISDVFAKLKSEITFALSLDGKMTFADTEEMALGILAKMPEIQEKLLKDVDALFEGDPAARGREEVLLSYPGFFAIAVYRVAHELYLMNIPYLPRIMTEYAHEKTGIDIHAGATIGEYFFIDHGTGIVIGETTVIGHHVKLYQGVTLGAKSFELDENGNPVKGTKRHPNIGNYVVIYANATILGGKTTVGDHAVIGGNVWITHSVPAGKTVVYSEN